MRQTDSPKYLMTINTTTKYCTLREAAEAYDCGFGKVIVGDYVLAEDFTVRELTDADKQLISDAADKYRRKK